jgi:ATP-binding cassette subfamily B protein
VLQEEQASNPLVGLDAFLWPSTKTNEALFCLAQASGWLAEEAEAPLSNAQPVDEATLNRSIESGAQRLGLEAEAVRVAYADTDTLLRGAGPALLRLPGIGEDLRFLALLRGDRRGIYLIDLDRSVQRVDYQSIADALWADLAAPRRLRLQPLLDAVGVDAWRRSQTERALLAEMIGSTIQRGGWLLRLPPGAPLRQQLTDSKLPQTLGLLVGSYGAQLTLTILAWWLIGRDALSGEFSWNLLGAWVLVLLTTIPFQMLTALAQRQVALRVGEIFKVRLLQGALQLQPEEIRHQGAGQFLGRVLAADRVEQVTLAGGFITLLSVLQLALAVVILAIGTGGWISALLLCGWALLLIGLGWRYGQANDAYATIHRAMTNDLVERMVGHRTRLAQEDPAHWHDEEDKILERYVRLQSREDRAESRLAALPRGWIMVGLAGFVYVLLQQQLDTAQIAISLGGTLLAFQALSSMTAGMQSLFDVRNAWREIGSLFAAAARPVDKDGQLLSQTVPAQDRRTASANTPTLLAADGVDFRYEERARPILQNLHLHIEAGERILLSGPSGSGKSTLAALLAGLRTTDRGRLTLWGHDRRTVSTAEWRRRVVVVPQFHENYIVTGTLAFNLLMGRRWPPTAADLMEAETICRELGLGPLIDRMPAGLEQMVGESGWRLSHGERSRVYMARAILQDADLLILDESFGALDAESLQTALACVRRRADTLMVIAHP